RQAVEEADERILDEVVAGIGIFDASVKEGAQPAFVACDELPPGVGIALADRLDQEAIAFVSHEDSVRKIARVLWHGLLVGARSETVPQRGGRPRVVARSPDRATSPDRRSPCPCKRRETFGRAVWHGRET